MNGEVNQGAAIAEEMAHIPSRIKLGESLSFVNIFE